MDPFIIGTLSEWLGVFAVLMIAGVSTRFLRRPLVFVYPKRELWVSLGIFALGVVIALVMSGLTVTPLQMRLAAAGFTVLPVGIALLVRIQPIRSAGWGRATLKPSLFLGFALAILVIFLRGKINLLLGGASAEAGSVLLLLFFVIAAEETIFRGFIQLRLNGSLGERNAWLAAAALHLLWRLPILLVEPAAFPLSLLLEAGQSLLAGYAMQKTGSIIPSTLYRLVSTWLMVIG